MRVARSCLFAMVIGFFVCSAAMVSSQDAEMVANPLYKYWASHPPGATVAHTEKTTLTGADKKLVPDGVDVKIVRYKLDKVSDESVVVQAVVTEREFLSTIQAAPTKITYPAKVKKANLEAVLHAVDAKVSEDTVKSGGAEHKCKKLSGALTRGDGELVEYQIWFCDTVPGGIVKQIRTTKQDGKVVAETVTELLATKGKS